VKHSPGDKVETMEKNGRIEKKKGKYMREGE
jgi:hypothetical protein